MAHCSPSQSFRATRSVVITVVAAALGVALPAFAGRDPWVRYENRNFIGYSNGAEERVQRLLHDLEFFRTAFLQVGNITVPPDAPKTVVLIPETKAEFYELAPTRLTLGFATFDEQRALVVMPARIDKDWSSAIVRHEFGHALMRYKAFAYPAWYREGFAELVSATEPGSDGKTFTVGGRTERAKSMELPIFSWRTLLSEEFDPHQLKDARSATSAYAQAWMLAHYATLGDGLKNAARLQAYLDRLSKGEDSIAAFEAAFGLKVEEIWQSALRAYSMKMPYYTFKIGPGAMDDSFAASTPADGEVQAVFRYLELSRARSAPPSCPSDGLSALAGRWAPLLIDLSCRDFVRLEPLPGGDTVNVSSSRIPGDGPAESFSYRYEPGPDDALRLIPPDAPGGEESLYIRYRTPDLVCLDQQPAGCGRLLHRCDP